MGPPFEVVMQAQDELQQVYTAAEMNDKIFMGKVMEIKGRNLVTNRGQGSTSVMVKANEKLGQAMLNTPVPKAKAKAAATPSMTSTRLRSTSPSPTTTTATTVPTTRASSMPPTVVDLVARDELDDVEVIDP